MECKNKSGDGDLDITYRQMNGVMPKIFACGGHQKIVYSSDHDGEFIKFIALIGGRGT